MEHTILPYNMGNYGAMKNLPEQSSASMIQFRLLIFEPYPADIVQLLQTLHSPQTPAELLLFSKI